MAKQEINVVVSSRQSAGHSVSAASADIKGRQAQARRAASETRQREHSTRTTERKKARGQKDQSQFNQKYLTTLNKLIRSNEAIIKSNKALARAIAAGGVGGGGGGRGRGRIFGRGGGGVGAAGSAIPVIGGLFGIAAFVTRTINKIGSAYIQAAGQQAGTILGGYQGRGGGLHLQGGGLFGIYNQAQRSEMMKEARLTSGRMISPTQSEMGRTYTTRGVSLINAEKDRKLKARHWEINYNDAVRKVQVSKKANEKWLQSDDWYRNTAKQVQKRSIRAAYYKKSLKAQLEGNEVDVDRWGQTKVTPTYIVNPDNPREYIKNTAGKKFSTGVEGRVDETYTDSSGRRRRRSYNPNKVKMRGMSMRKLKSEAWQEQVYPFMGEYARLFGSSPQEMGKMLGLFDVTGARGGGLQGFGNVAAAAKYEGASNIEIKTVMTTVASALEDAVKEGIKSADLGTDIASGMARLAQFSETGRIASIQNLAKSFMDVSSQVQRGEGLTSVMGFKKFNIGRQMLRRGLGIAQGGGQAPEYIDALMNAGLLTKEDVERGGVSAKREVVISQWLQKNQYGSIQRQMSMDLVKQLSAQGGSLQEQEAEFITRMQSLTGIRNVRELRTMFDEGRTSLGGEKRKTAARAKVAEIRSRQLEYMKKRARYAQLSTETRTLEPQMWDKKDQEIMTKAMKSGDFDTIKKINRKYTKTGVIDAALTEEAKKETWGAEGFWKRSEALKAEKARLAKELKRDESWLSKQDIGLEMARAGSSNRYSDLNAAQKLDVLKGTTEEYRDMTKTHGATVAKSLETTRTGKVLKHGAAAASAMIKFENSLYKVAERAIPTANKAIRLFGTAIEGISKAVDKLIGGKSAADVASKLEKLLEDTEE